jgi:hypothetical protein
MVCDPAGTRTQGPNIKSVVLYQLSYEIIKEVIMTALFLGVQKYSPMAFEPKLFAGVKKYYWHLAVIVSSLTCRKSFKATL